MSNYATMSFQFPIHEAVYFYLGGVDTELLWEHRGISGYRNKDLEDRINIQKKTAFHRVRFEKKKELDLFINEANGVFQRLLNHDTKWIMNYLGNKEIYFVLGFPRTGGTFLFTETANLLNVNWRSKTLEMLHDSIPDGGYLARSYIPLFRLYSLHQLAQFLVWAKRAFAKEKYIIQKRFLYAHMLEELDGIFKDNVNYVVTMRHPGPCYESFKRVDGIVGEEVPPGWKGILDHEGIIGEEAFDQLRSCDKAMLYWELYYSSIYRHKLKGNVYTANYSEDSMRSFVKELNNKHKTSYKMNAFNPKKSAYDDYWKSESVEKAIMRTRELAILNEYGDFGKLELI